MNVPSSIVVGLACLLVVTGCTPAGPPPAQTTVAQQAPAPGSTSAATTADAGRVSIPSGLRAAVIVRGDDPVGQALTDSAMRWLGDHGVTARLHVTADADDTDDALTRASDGSADVVIGLGDGVVDVFSLLSSQHLEQPYLLIGAQLPEPTDNVAAVIWDGAAFRGTGITDEASRPSQATPRKVEAAMALGMGAVVSHETGYVLLITGD